MTPDDGEPQPPDEVSSGEEDGSGDDVPDADVPAPDVPTDEPAAEHVPAVLPPGAVLTRADLQKQRRNAQKKERKRQHRWRRRILYSLAFIVFIAAAGVGGIYVYANYRFDQIKKIHAKHLIAQAAAPGQPFNLLLVGSDSRAFVGDNSTLSSEVGNEGNAGGQRSDVTIVARFDPAAKTVTVLSIPRDLWVDIPGHVGGISGMNRINAAYNSGPDLLIQTIEQDLGIPINHYVAVDFPGFSGMVNALGGITMDFPTAVKDAYTGLYVTQTGCQEVNGVTALQLVRARHLYYMGPDDEWKYDGESDFSRIQRQDAFFRAVLQKINASITNPLAINSFIGAAVGNLTIDDTMTQDDIFNIAEVFRGLPASHLVTETLPTVGYVTDGGADVLNEAQPYAQNMINAFNAIGAPAPSTTTTTTPKTGKGSPTTTTVPGVPHDQITVNVLNASTVNDIAHTTATALSVQGFYVGQIGDSSTQLTGGSSEILYGPDGYAAARTVGADLNGPVTYVADSSLSGQTVSLLIAGSDLTVNTASGTTGSTGAGLSTTTTTTTTTTTPGPPTTTTIPSDVYTNTESEPWNPYPCTIPAPTTTTTAKHSTQKTTTTTTTTAGKHPTTARTTTTTTTVPGVPRSQVTVNVFNASTVNGIAHTTATVLSGEGFDVAEIANASTELSPGDPSEVLYGPNGYAAALTLGSALDGPLNYVSDSDLSGQTVSLLISGSTLTVKSPSTTTTTSPKKAKRNP